MRPPSRLRCTPCKPQPRDQLGRGHAGAGGVEEHEVGLRLLHGHARHLPQAARQGLGVAVVVGQAVHVVVEGMEARRGADAGLAHAAAEALLPAPGLVDEGGTAGQRGPERRAEALGEVDPDRIERRGHVLGGNTRGHAGVHQAGAVHVRGPALAARHRRHGVELRQRPHRAAADVGGLLHLQQALRRRIARAWADGGAHGVGGELPALARQRQDLHARERRVGPALAGEDVAGVVRDHFLAGAAVGEDGDHVAHGAGGQEHRRLLAEQGRHPVAQGVHGRVVAVLLVADFGTPSSPPAWPAWGASACRNRG